MGRRSKRGHKAGSKRRANGSGSGEVDLGLQAKLENLTIEGGDLCKDPTMSNEESIMELTPFGFDGVCKECKRLYLSAMSSTTFSDNETQHSDTGLYVGSLAHISPNSECIMCRKLFDMRWSTSTTNQYHLHAFSAAKLVFGRSLKHLRAACSSTTYSNTQDSTLFAIVADSSEPVSISFALENSTDKRFLISNKIMSDDDELLPQFLKESDFKSDDYDHVRWLERTVGSRAKFTTVPMKAALHQASHVGFIYEYRVNHVWRNIRGCYSTSLAELEQQRMKKVAHVDLLVIQPTETGDTHTVGNLGYIPHSIRPKCSQWIQTLHSDGFYGRVIDPAKVDFSLLRGWMRQCQQNCDLENFIKERKRFQRIPFYLLDCQQRKIFKVPSKRNLRYIALSYVWGDSVVSPRPQFERLPFMITERCSNVIEDAITVVLKLGYRYLWVDALCVSPDAALRHEQIANMDVVYKNAELTIVAAAGTNADYGIPGVNERQRLQQTQIKIGKHHFVATSANPDYWLKISTYQTRGWTYQELFFSRRRLIFSDYQVWFECRSLCTASHQQESLSCPPRHLFSYKIDLEYLQDEDLDDAYFHKLPAQEKSIIYVADGTTEYSKISEVNKIFPLVSYEHHVSQFTKRKLSFEADSLGAVGSILDRFAQNGHSIFHLHGVPFIPRNVTYIEWAQKHTFNFKYGLLWTHGPRTTAVGRRSHFPSWSWAGWEGGVNWLVTSTNTRRFAESPRSHTEFEILRSTDGKQNQICSVESWRPPPQANSHPTELRFAAKVCRIPLRLSKDASGAESGVYLNDSTISSSRLHVTQTGLDGTTIKQTTFYGLWLGMDIDTQVNYVLVIQPTTARSNKFGGKYYERVGVMMISREWGGWRGALGVQGCLV